MLAGRLWNRSMRRVYWLAAIVCMACSAAAAANEAYLTDVMKIPSYSAALTRLLTNAGTLPRWTRQVLNASGDYVGAPAAYSAVDGKRYELFHTCKAHDCFNNQLEVMFSPNGAQAWGAVKSNGNSVLYLGAPTPAQRSALKAALQF
jgi:Inhibitor of vertebrate lysozyme (Ivy)